MLLEVILDSNDKKDDIEESPELPKGPAWGKVARSGMQAVGGAIPFAGGLFSAAAGHWSESEQQRVNEFLHSWIKMLEDELREKERVILEIAARLDLQDEEIAARVKSSEYQSLIKKAFRNWSGAESPKKQEYIRNILSNAASTQISSDDVVSLFIDWLNTYSEFHFAVIGELYANPGSTRGDVWRSLGRREVREDSADADLYKLLIRDLSTGGIVRQHRETDYHGNFVPKPRRKGTRGGGQQFKSAFDDEESYELTALGEQFVHYAMTEVTVKIEYNPTDYQNSSSPEPPP